MYYDQLDGIIDELVTMTHQVQSAVRRASQALLEGDAEVAEDVISRDAEIDAERERIEERSFELLALQQPVAGDLRMLVAALRMVADLERMAHEIAAPGTRAAVRLDLDAMLERRVEVRAGGPV